MNPTAPYTLAGFVSGAIYGCYKHSQVFPFGDKFRSLNIPCFMAVYSIPGTILGLTAGLLIRRVKIHRK